LLEVAAFQSDGGDDGPRRAAINSRAAAGKLALDLETITGATVS
jgi:hypothetical protein